MGRRFMKKLGILLGSILLILFSASCNSKTELPAEENTQTLISVKDETVFVTPITIYQTTHVKEHQKDNVLLSSGRQTTLRLSETDAVLYPALAEAFDKKTKNDLDNFINKVQLLKEYAESDEAYGYYENCSITISRADNRIISMRHNIQEYSGGIHPNHYITTRNLHPESGSSYTLEDIIPNTEELLNIIENKLFEKYPTETFYTEKGRVLKDYTVKELAWTLSYQGITFYFSPYSIAPYSEGTLSVTLWFDENPGFFSDEFTYAPKEGHTIPFNTLEELEFDRNLSDNRRDTLFVTTYSSNTIYYNGKTYENTEFVFDTVAPSLVCTGKPGSENYYLYLELINNSDCTLCIYTLNKEDMILSELLRNTAYKETVYD